MEVDHPPSGEDAPPGEGAPPGGHAPSSGEHDPTGAAGTPARPRWRASPAGLLLALAVTLPVVAAAVSIAGRDWYPSGDQALEILRIRDVGGPHTPLLGAWSRWGWAHPGPLLFWALAPFEVVLGDRGVLAGTAALNLLAAVGIVLVAHRRGGPHLAVLAALVVALLVRAMGGEILDPWNPWPALLAFVLFVLLVWSVTCGDLAMLPIAVLAGSFAVQCHLGYLPLVGGLLLLAVGVAVWQAVRARREPGPARASPLRWLAVAAGVAALLWLPALVQQVTGDPGNLGRILAYLRHPEEDLSGWDAVFGTLGAQVRPAGPWVTGRDTNVFDFSSTGATHQALAGLVVAVTAAVWAWRRGARDAARLTLVALVTLGLGVLATARVTGIFLPYVLRWWWGIAAVFWLSVAWSIVSAIGRPRVRSAVSQVALVGLAAAVAASLASLPAPLPVPTASEGLAAVVGPTAAALEPGGRYLVHGVELGDAEPGLHLALAERGFDVFAPHEPDAEARYGARRLASPDEVDGVVTVAEVGEQDLGWRPPPGSRRVAGWDPLSPRERARYRELEARIRADLGDGAPERRLLLRQRYATDLAVTMGASRADIDELNRLQARGEALVVYLSPPPRDA